MARDVCHVVDTAEKPEAAALAALRAIAGEVDIVARFDQSVATSSRRPPG